MRQRIGKKQSKHANSRVTRSKRTKKRTGKKRRVSVKMGGADAEVPYDAIVFDVDETILPKLCGPSLKLLTKNYDFNKDEKVRIYSYDTTSGKEKKKKEVQLKLSELKTLVSLLTEIKNQIPLFIATRCMSKHHINHELIKESSTDQADKRNVHKLLSELRKLRKLFMNETGLRMLEADSEYLLINPNTKETNIIIKEKYRKQEWAKYKAYFLQQLKEKLKEKLKKKDVKILFVDDDATNTVAANEAGFDTFTKNQQITPDHGPEFIYDSPIEWTINALDALKSGNYNTPDPENIYTFTEGKKKSGFKFPSFFKREQDDQEKKIAALAEAAVTGIKPPAE